MLIDTNIKLGNTGWAQLNSLDCEVCSVHVLVELESMLKLLNLRAEITTSTATHWVTLSIFSFKFIAEMDKVVFPDY
jgi:hypothetical protein